MSRRFFLFTLVLLAALSTFVLLQKKPTTLSGDELVRELVGTEELILDLGAPLKKLSRGMLNLQLPVASEGREIFAAQLEVRDLAGDAAALKAPQNESLVAEIPLPASASVKSVSRHELVLWEPLLKEVSYFEQAGFKIVTGEFVGENHDRFSCLVKFGGLAKLQNGAWASLKGKQTVSWQKDSQGSWGISGWQMKEMTAQVGSRLLFSERLDEALPDPADLQKARHSVHEEEVIKYYQSGKTRARSHDFSPISMSQKPALSVVDLDGDGLDDLYVMVRMGRNLLLRNRGDGTFEEVGADRELAFEGNSTCGIFADFDNDGDPDLLLGRSLERSLYLENNGSWFSEVKQEVELPALVISMSAADFNNDGLLDVYVSTYRLGALGSGNPGLGDIDPASTWPERFLPASEAAEFRERYRKEVGKIGKVNFLDQVGPPNLLLVNQGGGKFLPSQDHPELRLWKNSTQATWTDLDDDGDQDLYVANDFANDHLFRNDGVAGFQDISDEAGINAYGFAMGASFGDYDQDGRQDLYVTNMFSKAGRRILSKFEGVNQDYLNAANGNVLYRKGADGRFSVVSSLSPPGLPVAEAGWSWGGNFSDFDNDGDLDIYALSGYFTAPAKLASEVDL